MVAPHRKFPEQGGSDEYVREEGIAPSNCVTSSAGVVAFFSQNIASGKGKVEAVCRGELPPDQAEISQDAIWQRADELRSHFEDHGFTCLGYHPGEHHVYGLHDDQLQDDPDDIVYGLHSLEADAALLDAASWQLHHPPVPFSKLPPEEQNWSLFHKIVSAAEDGTENIDGDALRELNEILGSHQRDEDDEDGNERVLAS